MRIGGISSRRAGISVGSRGLGRTVKPGLTRPRRVRTRVVPCIEGQHILDKSYHNKLSVIVLAFAHENKQSGLVSPII